MTLNGKLEPRKNQIGKWVKDGNFVTKSSDKMIIIIMWNDLKTGTYAVFSLLLELV